MPQQNTVDVDQMIASLPRNEQVLVKRLRALVMECIPQATEKAYYDSVGRLPICANDLSFRDRRPK